MHSIEPTYLNMLCDVLGNDVLLNDSELKTLLAGSEISDISPAINRRRRIYNALLAQQQKDLSADTVTTFLHKFTYHIQHTRTPAVFANFLQDVNCILGFSGYKLSKEGKLEKVAKPKRKGDGAPHGSESFQALADTLAQTNGHPEVIELCRNSGVAEGNYFKLLQKTANALSEKIRSKAGLSAVGNELADQAFSIGWHGYPILAFNGLRTESEVGEQHALLHLLRGFLLMFVDERTRLAREPFTLSSGDALALLMLCSTLHTKVDESVRTPR
jgi:uncharacterized protein (TIGR02391 family)